MEINITDDPRSGPKLTKLVQAPSLFKCQVCSKTLKNSSSFGRHKRAHSQSIDGKPHQCNFCDKTFSQNTNLQIHLFYIHKQKREGVKYFKCECCSQEFVCRSHLESHVIDEHVVDKAFECPVCSKTFIDQETVDKHMKQHVREVKYFCDVCYQGYRHHRSFIRHLGVKHNRFFYCEKCCRSFNNKLDFDEHISDSKQELKCYICQELINSDCNLKIHTDSHVQEIKTEKIEIKTENETEDLKTNTKFKSELADPSNSTHAKFQCELCSKIFDRKAYFSAHRRRAHVHAEWKCNFEQCTKSFRWYTQLRRHRMLHSETKKCVCNICGKSFYCPYSLKQHEGSHVEDKKYKCKMCPKSFGVPSGLKNHIANKHGGQKPFKCPVVSCGTSWANASQFNEHLTSHETEKPFMCEMCPTDKAFKSLRKLKTHQRGVHLVVAKKTIAPKLLDAVVFICSSDKCSLETRSETDVALHYSQQHGLPKVILIRSNTLSSVSTVPHKFEMRRIVQKRYKCEICSKLLKLPPWLPQHQRTHSTATPFKCLMCSKSFKLKMYLKRHVNTTHQKDSQQQY